VMAAFIWVSILRMFGVRLVDFYTIHGFEVCAETL